MIGIGCNLLFSRRSGNPGPPIMMLSKGEAVMKDVVYPYPLVDENEINSSDDWVNDKVI